MTTGEQVEQFLQAVRAGDFDSADVLLPTAMDDVAVRLAAADLHTHRHRWADAALALEQVHGNDDGVFLRSNLCRNLAALQTHRPAVYRTMLDTLEANGGPFRPVRSKDGSFTLGRHDNTGRLVPLAASPRATVAKAKGDLKPLVDRGQPIAFLSVGDGCVLSAIAAEPPTLALGRQQTLYLIEPDAHLLLGCLLIHDWSGSFGPIAQPRVQWYTGSDWATRLRTDFLTDGGLVFPQANVKQGSGAAAIERTLLHVLLELGRLDAAAAAEVEAHYEMFGPSDYAAALRGELNRPPRVMLLTTRFSTVLQYSTRDAADALKQLGFDVHVLIEPTAHHGLTRSGLRRELASFKPDLVFQIDHHRFEHADVFPPGLPFVNWIQDLLPHLMTAAAGQQLTANDFVLTPSLQRWVDDFAYPARQCLEFRKLTRVPQRPRAWSGDFSRVVYVSNWSGTAEAARDGLLHGTTGATRELLAAACERMTAVYAAGDALATPGDVRRIVLSLVDIDAGNAAFVRQLTTRLFDRLNNLLFRQQGLTWAADACSALGLTLDIYGNGWDRHSTFAPFARGTVDYGSALESLTRDAGITLILEPFMALAHQRPLDALVAGGFCLVRDHPTNHTTNEWIELLAIAGDGAADAATLKASLRGPDVQRFLANMAACDAFDGSPQQIDHVATVRRMQRGGFLPDRGEMLPNLDRVTFNSCGGLRRRLQDATLNPLLCAKVARRQRQVVEANYGYRGGMERVMAFVAERLTKTTADRRQAA